MYKTENEILFNNNVLAFKLRNILLDNEKLFFNIADFLPYCVHTNRRKDLQWLWGNQNSYDIISISEIPSYNKIIELSDQQVLKTYEKQISRFNINNELYKSCIYFQYMLVKGKYQWILSSKIIVNKTYYVNFSFLVDTNGLIDLNFRNILNLDNDNRSVWFNFCRLTKREKEVMSYLSQGKSNNDLSSQLAVSKHTIRKHRENINRKLGIKSINELIKYAKIIGLRNYI